MNEELFLELIHNPDVCQRFQDVIEVNEITFAEPVTKAYIPGFHMLIGVDNA